MNGCTNKRPQHICWLYSFICFSSHPSIVLFLFLFCCFFYMSLHLKTLYMLARQAQLWRWIHQRMCTTLGSYDTDPLFELVRVSVSGSCLYCDHGQSIKARRGYWRGIWSTVCFTLPLFVCVFVWKLGQAPVSSHFLLTIVYGNICSLFLSFSLVSVLLAGPQDYGWAISGDSCYEKIIFLHLGPICLCLTHSHSS